MILKEKMVRADSHERIGVSDKNSFRRENVLTYLLKDCFVKLDIIFEDPLE